MSSDKTLTHALNEPLSFSNLLNGGEDDTTFEIEFRGPTYREMDLAIELERHIYAAMARSAEMQSGQAATSERSADAELTGDEAMMMLNMYGDMAGLLKAFEKLALKTGSINEKTDLAPKHIASMSISEIKRMCGAYIAFFTLPSINSEIKRVS